MVTYQRPPQRHLLHPMDDIELHAFFNELKSKEIDYLLLLYLQLPESMTQAYPVLVHLRDMCIEKGIRERDDFKSLIACLSKFIREQGIDWISPKNFVIARKRDEVLRAYDSAKTSWPIHVPYMFQTFGPKTRVFVLCANPQDAAMRMHDILEQRSVTFEAQVIDVCGIVEQPVDPDHTLTRQIFDCETLESYFQGRLTRDMIDESMRKIPLTLSHSLVESELINEEAIVTFHYKNRSRDVKNETDRKLSYHYLSNIVAPKWIHKEAMKLMFDPYQKEIDSYKAQIRDLKQYSLISDDLLMSMSDMSKALIFLDPSAAPGGPNGLSTMFSVKLNSEKPPTYEKSLKICLGKQYGDDTPYPIETPHDFGQTHMKKKDILFLLCNLSLTVPFFNDEFMTYKQEFVDFVIQTRKVGVVVGEEMALPKAKTSFPHPLASSSSSGLPTNIGALPKWFTSALDSALGGATLRLSAKPDKIKMLPKGAQENLIGMYHVLPCYCAQSMARGNMRLHEKNGTYVAVVSRKIQETEKIQDATGMETEMETEKESIKSDVIILLSCPDKTHRILENTVPGVVDIVRKSCKQDGGNGELDNSLVPVKETDFSGPGQGILWIMIDGQEAFKKIVDALTPGGAMLRPSKRLKICDETTEAIETEKKQEGASKEKPETMEDKEDSQTTPVSARNSLGVACVAPSLSSNDNP